MSDDQSERIIPSCEEKLERCRRSRDAAHQILGKTVSRLIDERNIYATENRPRIVKDFDSLIEDIRRDWREADESYSGETDPALKKNETADDLAPRRETTYLNLIGALLEVMLNGEKFGNQNAIIVHLVDKYYESQSVKGLSKSTLESVFPKAKNALASNKLSHP
jgi:hypothetical protein